MKIPFWLSFFLLIASIHNLPAEYSPARLISTEADPEAFIENSVNVINGDYCESATDLVIKGPDLFILQRFYNAADYITGTRAGGWRIFPERFLVIGQSGSNSKNAHLFDHEFQSPTYQKKLREHITNYIRSQGQEI